MGRWRTKASQPSNARSRPIPQSLELRTHPALGQEQPAARHGLWRGWPGVPFTSQADLNPHMDSNGSEQDQAAQLSPRHRSTHTTNLSITLRSGGSFVASSPTYSRRKPNSFWGTRGEQLSADPERTRGRRARPPRADGRGSARQQAPCTVLRGRRRHRLPRRAGLAARWPQEANSRVT